MRYQRYHANLAPALVALWNESLGDSFPMDERLWRQNVDNCSRTYWAGCWVAYDGATAVGFVIAKSPNCLNSVVVAPSHRRKGVGSALLKLAVDALTSPEGKAIAATLAAPNDPPANLITGQDYGHFFPGIPDSLPDATAFFISQGWTQTAGWCVDLDRDLADYEIAEPVAEKIKLLATHGIVLRACTREDVPALLEHVAANFSPRWLNETRQRIEMEPDPSDIKIAVRGNEVVGFAHTFTNRSFKLGPSVMWRGLLGADYGGLGPIGVGTDVRKLGLGLALLSYGVSEVKNAGMTHMAIDWTVLVEFYQRVGFEPWKRYTPYIKPIG